MADRFTVEIDGVADCLAAFRLLDTELRKNANGQLRSASKQIAARIPQMLGGSGSPQEAAVLAAAGPKSDRYVVVAVPNRKPRLSGMRRTPAASARRIGWAIEGGSRYPQFHGPAAGSMVARHVDAIGRIAAPEYERALVGIMLSAGLL